MTDQEIQAYLAALPAPPPWLHRMTWLWSQDDVLPYEDAPERAWRRLFGGELSSVTWIASWDVGDAVFMVDELGRVYMSSYPGNNSIGRIAGPFAVLPGGAR